MSLPPQDLQSRIGRGVAIGAVAIILVGAFVLAVVPGVLGAVAADPVPSRPPVVVVHDPAVQSNSGAPAGARMVSVLPSNGSRYFGVSVTRPDDGPDPSAQFTQAVGLAPTLQMFFESFADTFDVSMARRLTAAGRLPMVTWEPYDFDNPAANPFPLASIASGQFDDYLRAEADRFTSVDGPLVVRFAHEMNGDWYPWGVAAPGNTAADFVAAYRHVHDVVTAAGATNVVWMWAPNLIDAAPDIPLAPLYPGDDVVDWVGLSGYYTQDDDNFSDRIGPTLAQIDAIAPNKPILLAETAVDRTHNRAAQVAELVAGVRNTPRFIGLVWFDVAKRADWAVDDDPAAASALGAAISAGGFGATPETVPEN